MTTSRDEIERLQRELAARDKTIEALRAKDGWLLVPREPTGEMIIAGIKGAPVTIGEACDCYRAMLSAARSEGGKP